MRQLTIVLFLLISTFCFSQSKNTNVEKPKLIIGKSEYPITLGTEFGNECRLKTEEILSSNTPVFIYGYYSCFSNDQKNYYKVYYNDKEYYLNENEVIIEDLEKEILKDADSLKLSKLKSDAFSHSKLAYTLTKDKADKLLKLGKSKGLLIKYAIPIDESEYTDGTGFKISVKNLSKKGIKYIWVSVKGLNRVKDAVSTKTVKIIGEIAPQEEGSAQFEYVWMTDIVDSCKIPLIKIQYMDGSISTIQNAENLIVPDILESILFPE